MANITHTGKQSGPCHRGYSTSVGWRGPVSRSSSLREQTGCQDHGVIDNKVIVRRTDDNNLSDSSCKNNLHMARKEHTKFNLITLFSSTSWLAFHSWQAWRQMTLSRHYSVTTINQHHHTHVQPQDIHLTTCGESCVDFIILTDINVTQIYTSNDTLTDRSTHPDVHEKHG